MEDYYYVEKSVYKSDGIDIDEILIKSGLNSHVKRSEWLRYLCNIFKANNSWSFLNDSDRVISRIKECPCSQLAMFRLESIIAVCIFDPDKNVSNAAYERYQRFYDSLDSQSNSLDW